MAGKPGTWSRPGTWTCPQGTWPGTWSRPGTWTCPQGTWPGTWSRPGTWTCPQGTLARYLVHDQVRGSERRLVHICGPTGFGETAAGALVALCHAPGRL